MMPKAVLLSVLLLFFFDAVCIADQKVLPKEGSRLNYRLIGFQFTPGLPGENDTIQIAAGNYNHEDSFKENIISVVVTRNNRIIHEVPEFGKQYTWRVVYAGGKTGTVLYHFSTTANKFVDINKARLRVMTPAKKYEHAYVFMDGTKVLYNMRGEPVWYLPLVDTFASDRIWGFGDLKFTDQGTVTYLTNAKGGQVYEADFNGTVLWKGPNTGQISGDTIEYYNHEFIRLPDGHYMVLGNEPVKWELPGPVDSSMVNNHTKQFKIVRDSSGRFFQEMLMGTIVEYDPAGKVVWSWKSSGYFRKSDVYDHVNKKGVFDIDDVHINSLFPDEHSKCLYVSFKGMSRILKIKYPEGTVVNEYGKLNKGLSRGYNNKLFHHQHCCRISMDGYVYLYNNNDRYKGALPRLILMKEPAAGRHKLKKVWEYVCTTDGYDTVIKEVPEFSSLGSVKELPDRSLLACMVANKYCRVLIVSRDKEILWDAILERKVPDMEKWVAVLQYRANIIVDHDELERLIWKGEDAWTDN